MRVHVDAARTLRFGDGTPVTAASGVVPLGDGWLVVQDDSTIAAWRRPDGVTALRVLPSVQGLDTFRAAEGTKYLKPDLEAACPAEVDGEPAALLLGSGSSPRRMPGVLVRLDDGEPRVHAAELGPLYERVAERLGLPMGDVIRWFNRGNLRAGIPSASVDLPLEGLVAAVLGRAAASEVAVVHLLAVVDDDDAPQASSAELELRVELG